MRFTIAASVEFEGKSVNNVDDLSDAKKVTLAVPTVDTMVKKSRKSFASF